MYPAGLCENGQPKLDGFWLRRVSNKVAWQKQGLIALLNTVAEENDIFLHVVDDYADIAIIVVAIVLLAMWWKKRSPQQLKRTGNVMAVLAVLLIVATIFAITQEYSDPADFGNEIPSLLFGIFLLINRFV
jgi:heme A synthase